MAEVDALRAEYERLLEAYDYGAAAMAALEIALHLHGEGLVDEARGAYLEALAFRQPAVTAEARRRAGWRSPAEQAYDLVVDGRREDAVALLARVYEPANLGEFGLAVFGRDFPAATAMIYDMGGDLEISDAGRVAIDMAGRWLRDGDGEAAVGALALVAATGFTSELWEYALDSGSFADARAAAGAGVVLRRLALEAGDDERAALIAARVPE